MSQASGATLRASRHAPEAERTTWLRTRPLRRRDLLAGTGRESEEAAVEEHRLVEALPRHGEVDVVDPGQQGRRGLVAALELRDPGGVRRRGDGAEEDLGAVGGAEGRELLLVGEGTAVDGRRLERAGPRGRRRRIRDLEPDGGHGRGPVARVLLVAHHPRRSLGPQPRVLAAMPAPEGEPELPQQDVDLAGVLGTHLDEVEGRRVRRPRAAGIGGSARDGPRRSRGDQVLQPGERTPRLPRGPGDIGLPEDVVEDLERERPVVPGARGRGRRRCRGRRRPRRGTAGGGATTTARPWSAPARPRAGGRRSSTPGSPRSRRGRGRGRGCGSCRGRRRRRRWSASSTIRQARR